MTTRTFVLLQSCIVASIVGVPGQAQTFRPGAILPSNVTGFATAIAFAGDELVVGRPGAFPGFPMPPAQTGGVHVFGRGPDGEWTHRTMLTVGDLAIGDNFGQAVAAEDGILLVGAAARDSARGGVHVFERSRAGVWRETGRLAPADGAVGDSLGFAIALRGNLALVGAPGHARSRGAVFVFRRDAATGAWTREATLRPEALRPGDRFGAALAADGDRAIIGAPGPNPTPGLMGAPQDLWAGAAYVFARDPSNRQWRTVTRLTASGDSVFALGFAVSLAGGTALVSAPGTKQYGVVYEFRRERRGGAWQEAASLTGPTGAFAMFGFSLARAGDDVLVSAPLAAGTGGVWSFRFDRDARAWVENQQLGITGGGFLPFFGSAIALRNGIAVVGAPGADFFEGAGYVFVRDAASGRWRDGGTLVDDLPGIEPVVGGTVGCENGSAGIFRCTEVDLVAFLPVRALGGKRGIMVNDLWGWTDPATGREYAIVGRFDATTFIDVSDPTNPIYLGELPLTEGATPNLWRDIKVYQNHAFIVADGAGPHGVQVFDLTQLRDVRDPPLRFAETAHYDGIHSAHNIAINEATGFAYTVGNSMGGETCGGGLHMIDIRDPRHPSFAGCHADRATGMAKTGYTHDAQCVVYAGPDTAHAGREICFSASETALGIADVTDKSAPVAIASASYPNVGYAHQGWLSEDHRYFFLDDELDELAGGVPRTRTLVWDVTDLDDPVVLTEYLGPTAASDHNLYVRGQYLYESNYVAGLRIIDISDPEHPKEVGFFDTVPYGDDVPGFAGSWSNYPFFASGNIVVTSMREGVFVLRKRETLIP